MENLSPSETHQMEHGGLINLWKSNKNCQAISGLNNKCKLISGLTFKTVNFF